MGPENTVTEVGIHEEIRSHIEKMNDDGYEIITVVGINGSGPHNMDQIAYFRIFWRRVKWIVNG